MTVANIASDGTVEMTHELQPGMPAPWHAHHLELVEPAPAPVAAPVAAPGPRCLRCGAPAYVGLFSSTCLREGGCKTAEERVGARIAAGEPEDDIKVSIARREATWHLEGESFPDRAMAYAAWHEKVLAEERAR